MIGQKEEGPQENQHPKIPKINETIELIKKVLWSRLEFTYGYFLGSYLGMLSQLKMLLNNQAGLEKSMMDMEQKINDLSKRVSVSQLNLHNGINGFESDSDSDHKKYLKFGVVEDWYNRGKKIKRKRLLILYDEIKKEFTGIGEYYPSYDFDTELSNDTKVVASIDLEASLEEQWKMLWRE